MQVFVSFQLQLTSSLRGSSLISQPHRVWTKPFDSNFRINSEMSCLRSFGDTRYSRSSLCIACSKLLSSRRRFQTRLANSSNAK